MAWSGRELVLFEHELVPNPSSKKPAVTRAAALDLETGSWRRLPDSEILATGPWALDEGRLINPTLGGADGGEVGNWGRTYHYGGILDPASGDWSALPSPPAGEADFGSGVLTESGGHYFGYRGWILDATTMTWIAIPPFDTDELVTGRSAVAAGKDLLVFGGARPLEVRELRCHAPKRRLDLVPRAMTKLLDQHLNGAIVRNPSDQGQNCLRADFRPGEEMGHRLDAFQACETRRDLRRSVAHVQQRAGSRLEDFAHPH